MKKRANNIRSQHTRLLNGLPPTSTAPRNLKKNGMTYATYATAISRCLRYQTALEPTTTLKMMSMLHMSIGDETKKKDLMENLHLFSDLARSSPELAGMFELEVPACVSAASGNSSTLVSAWHQNLTEQEGNTLEDWGKECEHQVLSQVAALFGFSPFRKSRDLEMWNLVFLLSVLPSPSAHLKAEKYLTKVVPACWAADLRKRTGIFLLLGEIFLFFVCFFLVSYIFYFEVTAPFVDTKTTKSTRFSPLFQNLWTRQKLKTG